MMRLWPGAAATLAILFLTPSIGARTPALREHRSVFQRRYVLVFANLNRSADSEKVLRIMKRAAAVGYNGVVLGTTGGQYIDIWNRAPARAYVAAFAALRERADSLHMALIPYAISPNEVGYAAPDLVEAIPCRDTPFEVHGRTAEPVSSPSQMLTNAGFEAYRGNSPDAWGHDKPGVITFLDTAVRHGGEAAVRIQDTGRGDPKNGHGRLYQEVPVTPFRAYEFSVWIKTNALTDPSAAQFYFEGADGGQPLVYANREAGLGAPLKPTQDWTKYTVDFNSASNTRLELFFGIWSNHASGTLWLDDADMHEIGLIHTARRASLPLTVTSFDGAQAYAEGRDYIAGDGKLTLPAGSHIPDGARLKVSWYQRADMIGPPFANASHAEYFRVEENIARKLDTLFAHPPGFMMTYDEWRVANWDPAGGRLTAGQYMAQTVRRSIDLLRRINPRSELYVWSDMFDPNENALSKYYLCNGPLTGSWKGLTKDTTLVTWTGGTKALRFFSDQGMRQVIGGYYSSLGNVKDWLDAVDQAEAGGAKGIDGFMYTTWDENYTDIEKVAAMIKARGRWGSGPAARRQR